MLEAEQGQEQNRTDWDGQPRGHAGFIAHQILFPGLKSKAPHPRSPLSHLNLKLQAQLISSPLATPIPENKDKPWVFFLKSSKLLAS